MKKQITLGLIAGVLALSTAAFTPTEAQARDNNQQQLNQLAMQMYMNNIANQQNLAAQQQYGYGYNPYYNNNNNRWVNNQQYCQPNNNNRWSNNWNNNRYLNNGYNNYGYNTRSSIGNLLNRIF
ncbi:MAG: hypothetical protein IAF58_10795 [Leptolyngbya sp.]|nr:hypothetical protein [Candidatus Melainabacteria bacterium]